MKVFPKDKSYLSNFTPPIRASNDACQSSPKIIIIAYMAFCPKKLLFLLVLTVFIGFSVVFAEPMAAEEHDHDCTGAACPVCLHIQAGGSYLKLLKTAVSITSFISNTALPVQITEDFTMCIASVFIPIAQKVRFNT